VRPDTGTVSARLRKAGPMDATMARPMGARAAWIAGDLDERAAGRQVIPGLVLVVAEHRGADDQDDVVALHARGNACH
jgi:hypothetical protein